MKINEICEIRDWQPWILYSIFSERIVKRFTGERRDGDGDGDFAMSRSPS